MRYDKGKCCLDGTRRGILEKIKLCIDNKDGTCSEKRVFLLTGVAGSGKSTIAHSIALHYDTPGQLGSSFFFSVAYKEKSQPRNLFRTVARDVAENHSEVQRKLCDIIKTNSSLCTTESIQEQFEKFLRDPLNGIRSESKVVIVIDALDECEKSGDERRRLLNIFAEEISALPYNFRFLLTVRTGGIELFSKFETSQHVRIFTTDDIELESKKADIRIFFSKTLSGIAEELASINSYWLEDLIRMSGNLFIWASTACSYILEDDGRKYSDKLQTLLSIEEDEADSDSPVGIMYKLYTEVMRSTFKIRERLSKRSRDQALEGYRKVVGMVQVAFISLSTNDMDEFFGTHSMQSKSEARPVVVRMGTLLDGAGDSNMPVKLLHASFGDYLRDKARSGEFYIDERHHHGEMAKYCLNIINSNLKFNMFNSKDVFFAFKLGIDLEDLEMRRNSVNKTLRYACQYWQDHITQMRKDDFILIQQPLENFLFEGKHLLQWIEVISIIGLTEKARDALLCLYHWLKDITHIDERTSKLICECYHLLRCFETPIAFGPLQVYLSALPYAPSDSLLHKYYKEHLIFPTNILFGHIQDIRLLSPNLSSQEVFKAVAFSSDGSRIGAVSESRLEIFDFATFSRINQPMKPNGLHNLIAFSPDGNKIAVAGAERYEVWSVMKSQALIQESVIGTEIISLAFPSKDILFYCARSGERVELLDRNLSQKNAKKNPVRIGENIICVAMSPNASHVGSISKSKKLSVLKIRDRSVVADNIDLGDAEDTFKVLSISCEGEYIACGSDKGTVKLWDSRSASFVWRGEVGDSIKQILMPLSLKNKQLVTVSGRGDSEVHVWDILSGAYYEHKATSDIYSNMTGRAIKSPDAISPDGRCLVSTLGRVWAVESSKEESGMNNAVPLPGENLLEVILLQDGSLLAWGTIGKEWGSYYEPVIITLWDNFGTVNSSRQTLSGHTNFYCGLFVSPDGRSILTLETNWMTRPGVYEIFLWGRDSDGARFMLREKRELDPEGAGLEDIVFLPDGSILAAGRTKKDIAVFNNLESGSGSKEVLEGNPSSIYSLKISPDGRRLVCLTFDEIYMWCREGTGTSFQLQKKHKYDHSMTAERLFDKLRHKWVNIVRVSQKGPQSTDLESQDDDLEMVHKTVSDECFGYKEPWVILGKYVGERLWYIPECFSKGNIKIIQIGHKTIVYSAHFAVVIEHKEDIISTILNNRE